MYTSLFSIVTPTYNVVSKIGGTIDSVLGQAGSARSGLVEMIVVDGGSTDGTVDVLKSYGHRIKWISEPDKGLYDAMNKGIGMSSGRFINFQGAGDILRPGILNAITPQLPDRPDCVVYGKVYLSAEHAELGRKFTPHILRKRNLPHQAVFYERSVFDIVGLFSLDYPVLADYALNIRCFGNPAIQTMFIDKMISNFEGGGISDTSTDNYNGKVLGEDIKKYLGWPVWAVYEFQRLVRPITNPVRQKLAGGPDGSENEA
jgi:glycosyltransferase involved in cell wall biosynthesis